MTIEFLLTALVVVITPGPGVLFTLAAGLSRGRRASLIAAFGCTLGIVPHMAAAITGLAALLHTSALAFQLLKYLGVGYLLYMAWQTARSKDMLSATADGAPRTAGRMIIDAVLLNVLNPKLSLFFFAFLPQFVKADEPQALARMIELSAVFMALTLAVFALYGCCAAAVRRHVLTSPGVLATLRRLFAGTFLALGIKLALIEPA